jgi:hypothetical protein
LLRALAGSAGWQSEIFVDSRQVAKDKGVAATDKELADVEGYLVDQGWLAKDEEAKREGWYALTRHGIDESQRKMPAEPKPYQPKERDQ